MNSFGYQCLVTHRRSQTNNKPIQTALHSVLLCWWPQNVMQSGNILLGCDDRVLCSKALVNLEVLQSNCKECRRNMRRVNIYPSVPLTTTGPDRRRNVTADAFPLKFPAALPYSFILLVGFPHSFRVRDFHMSRNILSPRGCSVHKSFPV